MNLTTDDTVQLLTLDDDHQVLNPDTIANWHAALDTVEAVEGPSSLVITGSGKSFHQGLDLEFLSSVGDGHMDFIKTVHALFGRLLRLDLPTVSAINGHAQAAGAMLSLCTDLRIMRADRGWFRLPEVALGMGFPVVMDRLIRSRIPQPTVHRLMVLGQQMGGAEAAEHGVVDVAVEGVDANRELALQQAAALAAYRGPNLRNIRTTVHAELLAHIDADGDRADLFVP
ncbi:enoyl-CoA hydratase/isomerase family protein [Euzebya tangerina]|uniref:enoyl-CoA hydratase/isomerase family protein n=1 Tax=Euzebya tangerina TaxID=591198 RepID=UPI000E30E064|nr:enoyl-CoA hydratase/isomerase family protein [Euzebya tangerina]